MEHLRQFMRWCLNEHPEIVKEYTNMLQGAVHELEHMIKEREKEIDTTDQHLPKQR